MSVLPKKSIMKQKLFLLLTIISIVFSACKKAETKDEKPTQDSVTVETEVPDTHTTQNSVDWEGEYKGITPCEDCDGVETAVMLNFDNTFTQSLNYIGKGGPYESKGTFEWDESGSKITLKFDDGSEAKYFVSEGYISLLDDYGMPIEGEEYVLRK